MQGIPVSQYNASPPASSTPKPPAGGVEAVFAELNRGEAVTKGLRKVDKSEMTHKNPALRAQGVVPVSPALATSEFCYLLISSHL
jgi:adenylyl cyclase-associated protein